PRISPASVAKMNREGPETPPPETMKPVPAALATMPVGPPGTLTVIGTFAPAPVYSVEVSVPLLATHHGEVGSAAIPQPLTRFASTVLPSTPLSDWSEWTVYEFCAWMFFAVTGAAASTPMASTASGSSRRGCMDPPPSRVEGQGARGMGERPPDARRYDASVGSDPERDEVQCGRKARRSELLLVVDLRALE